MQAIAPPSPKPHKWVCFKHTWSFSDVRRIFDRTSGQNDQIVSSPLLTPTMEPFQIAIRINIQQWISENFRIFLDIAVEDDVDADEVFQDDDPEFKYFWMVYDSQGNPYNIRDWGLIPFGNQFTIVTTIHYKTKHGFWFSKYENLENYRVEMQADSEKAGGMSENLYGERCFENSQTQVDCVVFVRDHYGYEPSSTPKVIEWDDSSRAEAPKKVNSDCNDKKTRSKQVDFSYDGGDQQADLN